MNNKKQNFCHSYVMPMIDETLHATGVNTMRYFILLITLLLSASMTMAQTNPKSGFIITNNGDTVRGSIDFRTNEKLSKQCTFKANGTEESKTYKPGEIEGFRFDDGGKYFVTRRLNVNGTSQLYFAEFIVQGKMNLYCVTYNSDEYYFFEREDGEMAEITKRTILSITERDIEAVQSKIKQEKREQYGKVKTLMNGSWKAVEELNDEDLTRGKLVKVLRDYHNDMCTDGSSCVVYEYKEESDKVKAHLKAFAGYVYYSQETTDRQSYDGENYSGSGYEIGLGLDIELDRVLKGFGIEAGVAFTPYTSEHNIKSSDYTVVSRYKKSIVTISLGAVKRFGNGKIQPLVRGGGFLVTHFGLKEHNHSYNQYNSYDKDYKWDNSLHYGVYLGAGVQIALGKHYARVHGDWYKSLEPSTNGKMMKWGLTAEFAL